MALRIRATPPTTTPTTTTAATSTFHFRPGFARFRPPRTVCRLPRVDAAAQYVVKPRVRAPDLPRRGDHRAREAYLQLIGHESSFRRWRSRFSPRCTWLPTASTLMSNTSETSAYDQPCECTRTTATRCELFNFANAATRSRSGSPSKWLSPRRRGAHDAPNAGGGEPSFPRHETSSRPGSPFQRGRRGDPRPRHRIRERFAADIPAVARDQDLPDEARPRRGTSRTNPGPLGSRRQTPEPPHSAKSLHPPRSFQLRQESLMRTRITSQPGGASAGARRTGLAIRHHARGGRCRYAKQRGQARSPQS